MIPRININPINGNQHFNGIKNSTIKYQFLSTNDISLNTINGKPYPPGGGSGTGSGN